MDVVVDGEEVSRTYEAINPAISEAVSNILHSSDLTSLSALVSQNNGKRAKEQRVKRPMNAFMLYAQVARRKVATKYPNLNYAKLSKTLGKIWQVLPEDERRPFIQEAERLRAQHKLKHPDYKYTPKRSKEKKSRAGISPRKAQSENLKPEELFNILQAKRGPTSIPTSLPMRNPLINSTEKIPFNLSMYLDDSLSGAQSWVMNASSSVGMSTTPRIPSKAAIQSLDYMEYPNYGPTIAGNDLRWLFSEQLPVSSRTCNVNHLLDTFVNPNPFLSQKMDGAPPLTNEPLSFFAKDYTSGFVSNAATNQLVNGFEFPQLTPTGKHFKRAEPIENISSFFEGKPHIASYMAI